MRAEKDDREAGTSTVPFHAALLGFSGITRFPTLGKARWSDGKFNAFPQARASSYY
jgi:hypothetical protein